MIDDRAKVRLARLFIIAIVAMTYGLSLLRPPSVFALGVWCFSGFASLFPLVVAAVYWRRLTKWGALASVLATIGTWGYFFGQAVHRAVQVGNPGPIRTFTVDITIGGQTYETMPVATIFACSLVTLCGAPHPPTERGDAQSLPNLSTLLASHLSASLRLCAR